MAWNTPYHPARFSGTTSGHDRAALGVEALYAAAWVAEPGVVLGTAGPDGRWRQTLVAVPGGGGPCALAATADGVLLACADGTTIRCLRCSLDAIVGAGMPGFDVGGSWHHDDAAVLAALKERQPAATTALTPPRPPTSPHTPIRLSSPISARSSAAPTNPP